MDFTLKKSAAFDQAVQEERADPTLSVFQGHRGSELLADLQRSRTRGQDRRLRNGSRHLQVGGSRGLWLVRASPNCD